MRKSCYIIFAITLTLIAFSFTMTNLEASTVTTIDAEKKETYWYNQAGLMTGIGGEEFLSAQWSGSGSIRTAFIGFDISSLPILTYDYAYLSLTEIRTDPSAAGTAEVYCNNGALPTSGMINGVGDIVAQQNWESGFTNIGSITTTGIGGNHLLFDVSSAVQTKISSGSSAIGFFFKDTLDDDLCVGFLGKNYYPGPGANQYDASSLYEYPTLIATLGSDITPFNQLPSRPILGGPVNPPIGPPSAVPEPATMLLFGLGGIAMAVVKRRRKV